jgi:hypothetical protein
MAQGGLSGGPGNLTLPKKNGLTRVDGPYPVPNNFHFMVVRVGWHYQGPVLHQKNLVFTFLTFSLLFVLFCRKIEKAIPYTCQSACQAHYASRVFAQAK